jgi:peptidoglycan/LPS O-acetylase OafA/YrhL
VIDPIKTEHLPGGRLLSIDALRGLAALGVVLYHVPLIAAAAPNSLLQWPAKLVQVISSFGYIGVFLFFVISGFCIHLQWARTRVAGQQPRIEFGAFWKRRLRRLYPPYLIAFALFLGVAAFTTGIDVTHFFVYDVVMHLLMLHNLDPNTCYSINGVFWTLAIEEQLYLAYFLLLFLRTRWGWGPTLIVCAFARVGWFFLVHFVSLATGIVIPVPESAASHWFTWALGAIAVEAAVGLVVLPKWCRNVWLGVVLIIAASVISMSLPLMSRDKPVHGLAWMLMHPAWGLGFFIVVNRAVQAERSWLTALRKPRLITSLASLGVFSYSLYLTHELVIMQSWWFVVKGLSPILNALLIVTPATIAFAWLFFLFCEKPYMRKTVRRAEFRVPSSGFPVARSEFGVSGLQVEASAESEV